nr:MAG TPA: YonK protein [Caudoviricetes sp.]
MAKIIRKNALSVQGVVNIENGKITFSVEDMEGEVVLAKLMSDFNGQEVKLSVNQTDEIV